MSVPVSGRFDDEARFKVQVDEEGSVRLELWDDEPSSMIVELSHGLAQRVVAQLYSKAQPSATALQEADHDGRDEVPYPAGLEADPETGELP